MQTSSSFTQRLFVLPQAISTCRPVPASPAAVPPSSSYQHLQTSSNFINSSSWTLKLPVPADQLRLHQQQFLNLPQPTLGDWLQINPAAVPAPSNCINCRPATTSAPASPSSEFCITIVYKQPLPRLTQHTKITLTHPQLTKVLYNWVSISQASATSNWIFRPTTDKSHTPTQTTS